MSSTSSLPSGYIDLASFDELETYMYGSADATTYFVRATKKSTWFTQVPVPLSTQSGQPQFGQKWSAKITRGGDYLQQLWLRAVWPSVTLNQSTGSQFGANGRLRWCANPMHNLINEISLTFNDIVESRLDSFFLDFWAAFTVPGGKQVGYQNMIGNISVLTNPLAVDPSQGIVLPSRALNLPIPLPHCRDSGVSLPTAALPYNEMAVTFDMRDWTNLLIVDNIVTGASSPAQAGDISGNLPQLSQVICWANYAIVSNHERRKMGKNVRDILIEQVQTAPPQTFQPSRDPNPNYNLHFSHAVKAFFFAVRNSTNKNEWSNYTSASPVASATGISYDPNTATDPIANFTLLYENTARLNIMPVDYFSLVNPFYHAISIPVDTGLHAYSYSIFFPALNPMGSTNYGKLTGVIAAPVASTGSINGSTGVANQPGISTAQSYQFIFVALTNNIVRISGGALGFPVL